MKYTQSLFSLVFLLLLGGLVSAKTEEMKTDPKQITEQLKKRYEEVKKEVEHKEVSGLQALLMLERDLRIVMSPEKIKLSGDRPKELSSNADKKIRKLHEEIRALELARIVNALKTNAPLYLTDAAIELNKLESKLDEISQRAAKRLISDIDKLNKKMSKKQSSSIKKDKSEMIKEITEMEAKLTALKTYIYPSSYTGGFKKPADENDESPAGQLLSEITNSRDMLFTRLKEGKGSGEGSKEGAEINGIYVYSGNLGVILDNSGSMTPFLSALRAEIDEHFSETVYKECRGCAITSNTLSDFGAKLYSKPRDTLSYIYELTVLYEVDTIYWFSDLNDVVDVAAVRWLRILLRKSDAKFCVKSVGRDPREYLQLLITNFSKQ